MPWLIDNTCLRQWIRLGRDAILLINETPRDWRPNAVRAMIEFKIDYDMYFLNLHVALTFEVCITVI